MKLGDTSCYYRDFDFNHFCEISEKVAVDWVKEKCPDTLMSGYVRAKDLTIGDDNNDTGALANGWLNKLFVVVERKYDKIIALDNHDGNFTIIVKEVLNSYPPPQRFVSRVIGSPDEDYKCRACGLLSSDTLWLREVLINKVTLTCPECKVVHF